MRQRHLKNFGSRTSRTGVTGTTSPRDGDLPWLPDAARALASGEYPGGPVQAKPNASRRGRLFGAVFMAVVWNSLTAVFVGIAINSHLDGDPEWFLTFFIIPFVLIGLFLIGAVIYSLMALFNPTVPLTFSRAVVPLGESVEVSWSLSGAAHRLRSLHLTLEAVERATYRRGTDTITDEHVFYEHDLHEADATDPTASIADGSVTVHLPANTMHSFEAKNNRIVWRVRVIGHIPRWPNVKQEYELAVVPPELDINPRGMF